MAIATWLKDAKDTLPSFLRHHLGLGFCHIFLFFDDPDDGAIPIAQSFRDVSVFALTREFQATEFPRNVIAGIFERRIETHGSPDMDRRQMNSIQVGVRKAVELGFDWLLHIDSDELFHLADGTLAEHFEALDEEGIAQASYRNFEAVPEQLEIIDPFTEVTLFKKHPLLLLDEGIVSSLTDIAWKPGANTYYFSYGVGKSAVRLAPDVAVLSNHHFVVSGQPLTAAGIRASKAQATLIGSDPIVLHYDSCGLGRYVRKYQNPGWDFVPPAPGGDRRRSRGNGFTLESLERIRAGDLESARRLYERDVLLADPEVRDGLIARGVLVRIDGPAIALRERPPVAR